MDTRTADLIRQTYDAIDKPDQFGRLLGQIALTVGAEGISITECFVGGDEVLLASWPADRLPDVPCRRVPLKPAVRSPSGLVADHSSLIFRNQPEGALVLSLYGTDVRDLATDAMLAAIAPHLVRCLETQRKINLAMQEAGGLRRALDALRIGMAVCCSRGRLMMANRAFERHVREFGKMTTGQDGHLSIEIAGRRHPVENLAMPSISTHGHDTGRSHVVLCAQDDGATALLVEIAALPVTGCSSLPKDGPAFAVLSRYQDDPAACDGRALRDLYGLTGAETELVRMVCDGWTNAQIAHQRARSVATINAQLKSILTKTDSVNRTRLTRMATETGQRFMGGP